MEVVTARLKALFLNNACVLFFMDWAFVYFHIIYIAHGSALLTWTWEFHFLQHGTLKGARGNFTCWQVWKTRHNSNSAHYIAEQSVVFYTKRMREGRKFKLGQLEIVHSLLEAGLKYWFVIFCGWKSDRIWNQNLIWANKVQLQGLCRDGSGLFWSILMIKYHSFIKVSNSSSYMRAQYGACRACRQQVGPLNQWLDTNSINRTPTQRAVWILLTVVL